MVEFQKIREERPAGILSEIKEALFGDRPDPNTATEQLSQLSFRLTGRGFGREENGEYKNTKLIVEEIIRTGRGIIGLSDRSRLRIRRDREGNVVMDIAEVIDRQTGKRFRELTRGEDQVVFRGRG